MKIEVYTKNFLHQKYFISILFDKILQVLLYIFINPWSTIIILEDVYAFFINKFFFSILYILKKQLIIILNIAINNELMS